MREFRKSPWLSPLLLGMAEPPPSARFLPGAGLSFFLTPAWAPREMDFDRARRSCSISMATSIHILQVHQRPLRPLTK